MESTLLRGGSSSKDARRRAATTECAAVLTRSRLLQAGRLAAESTVAAATAGCSSSRSALLDDFPDWRRLHPTPNAKGGAGDAAGGIIIGEVGAGGGTGVGVTGRAMSGKMATFKDKVQLAVVMAFAQLLRGIVECMARGDVDLSVEIEAILPRLRSLPHATGGGRAGGGKMREDHAAFLSKLLDTQLFCEFVGERRRWFLRERERDDTMQTHFQILFFDAMVAKVALGSSGGGSSSSSSSSTQGRGARGGAGKRRGSADDVATGEVDHTSALEFLRDRRYGSWRTHIVPFALTTKTAANANANEAANANANANATTTTMTMTMTGSMTAVDGESEELGAGGERRQREVGEINKRRRGARAWPCRALDAVWDLDASRFNDYPRRHVQNLIEEGNKISALQLAAANSARKHLPQSGRKGGHSARLRRCATTGNTPVGGRTPRTLRNRRGEGERETKDREGQSIYNPAVYVVHAGHAVHVVRAVVANASVNVLPASSNVYLNRFPSFVSFFF